MGKKVTYSNGDTPRICIIGAGFSGICAGIQLKRQLGLTSFTIFEINKDLGGTWLTNTYPGCACDVPSHLYSLSFELNPDWSENYSSQPEILRYIRKVAQKYELHPHIKFETEVKTLTWNEPLKKWELVALDKNSNEIVTDLFDIVINGPGGLRVPNVPDEFRSFKGPLIHSAHWNPDISLDNKIVGIIGSGASAIQIIPQIAKTVNELHTYQRKPAWVLPRPQYKFSGFTRTLFFYFPFIAWMLRCFLFLINESFFPAFKKNSWMSRVGAKISLLHKKLQIRGSKILQEKLTPNYTFGCKRLLPSNNYYPAMALPNVTLHTEKIIKVANQSILTEDGHLQHLDVLILATGYRVQDYFAPLQIYGKDSEDILATWKNEIPRGYLGIVGTSAPNHFALLGPGTGIGHNSGLFMIECQVNFTINVIREMLKRDARIALVTKAAEDNFMSWIIKELNGTVWGSSKCGSWYANKDGIITALWPQSCISYWNSTRKVDLSDFEFS